MTKRTFIDDIRSDTESQFGDFLKDAGFFHGAPSIFGHLLLVLPFIVALHVLFVVLEVETVRIATVDAEGFL